MKPTSSDSALFILTLSIALSLMSGAAVAGEFAVQIGAFRQAPSGFAEAATKVGALVTSETPEGVTRFQIGQFDSMAAAETAKSALIGAGYADAYIVQKNVSLQRSRDEQLMQPMQPTSQSPRANVAISLGNDPLAGLSESLRSRVVILDGAYYVKEGDQFIPLSEAVAAEN